MGTGAMCLEYPIGGSILVLNLDYLLICSVVFPTTDKLIDVGIFLMLVGRFSHSSVNDFLES